MNKNIKQIGRIIQNLRKDLGMTGEELARRAGLSQPKISKIETGFATRTKRSEIEKILNILGASSIIQQQVFRVLDEHAHERSARVIFYGVQTTDLRHLEATEKRTQRIRLFAPSGVPALLQTLEYRTALLETLGLGEGEMRNCIRSTVARQDAMWGSKRSYHFILYCNVLYRVITPIKAHLAQLDRLERALHTPNIKLGIVPLEAGTAPLECGPFVLYDNHTLRQALPQREIVTQEKTYVELLSDVFSEITRLALYDQDAVWHIRRAMDYFS